MTSAPLRYSRTAVLLHWFLAAALLAQISFGWLLSQYERGTPARGIAVNLHKSAGLVLALLILVRLVYRLRHPAPPYPASMPAAKQRAATIGHGLLYACMVLQPLTGYIGSNVSKHGVVFFGLVTFPPWGPDDKSLYALFNGAHDLLGLVFSVLVAGHIALGVYHARLARDGIADRMRLS